jgi:site-specific DNA recombinase
MNRRAALYIRVSTVDQAEHGYSIHAQKEILSQFASDKGYDVCNVYVDDGISGRTISARPQLQMLLNDAQDEQFDAVVVWNISRLARSAHDFSYISKLLFDNGITLISKTEGMEFNTASGTVMMQLLAIFAEFESNRLSENVQMGMQARAKDGKWNGGQVLGYDIVDGDLIVNEEEAIEVKEIFNLYIQGHGYKYIAQQLNHSGYKTKRGKEFSTTTVKTILENPVYVGVIQWGKHRQWSKQRRQGKSNDYVKVRGAHQPIITDNEWDLAQRRLSSNITRPSTSDKPYFLSGLIKCPQCGHNMVQAHTNRKLKSGEIKKHRYYQCGQFKSKGSSVCKSNNIPADKIEEYAVNRFIHITKYPLLLEHITVALSELIALKETTLQREHQLLVHKKEVFSRKLKKYYTLFEDDIMDVSELKDRVSEIKQQISTVESHLTQKENRLNDLRCFPTITTVHVKHLLKHIADNIYSLPSDMIKTLFKSLFHELKYNHVTKQCTSIPIFPTPKWYEVISQQILSSCDFKPMILYGHISNQSFTISVLRNPSRPLKFKRII